VFESTEFKEIRRGPAFWISAGLCALAVIFVVNLFRVNLPERNEARATPFVQPHTEGPIASEIARIEAGGFLPFRANFNHRVTVKGNFRVDKTGPWIAFLILDESNYRKWQAGEGFTSLTSTGMVPVGRVTRVLETGTFYFVFDNRSSEKEVVVDIDLRVE
jgi:hypothetical protein